MSRIRGRDTKPEMVVRRWLWRQGYRYRLDVKSLPGRPDIVMRKWRTVIFVNGCFWHGHDCRNTRPADNAEYWQQKRERNIQRDVEITEYFQKRGCKVIRIWECELKNKNVRILENKLKLVYIRH